MARSRFDCADGYCGSLDCQVCHGTAALRYRQEMAHESHEDPKCDMPDCPECQADAMAPYYAAEAKYDALKDEGRI